MDCKRNNNLIIGINLSDYGSTGNIMLKSLKYAHLNGPFDTIACVPNVTHNIDGIKMISFNTKLPIAIKIYYKLSRKLRLINMQDGNHYKEYTKTLISIIKKESKNYTNTIIHLHNVHMCNLDVNRLYKYLKKANFKVLYTLHDCWALTGGCYYYDHIKCDKWQINCKKCPQGLKHTSYLLKKRTTLLNKIPHITFINVSSWGDSQFKKSLLKSKPSLINRGETNIKPFRGNSTLKKELNIIDKRVILFVSAYWNEWKGTKYIYELADIIDDNYVILVVGTIDKRGYRNIIQVDNVDSLKLAEYYSIADVYASVTQAEQLGLTTCEAQICGVPVVGFGNGGSRETFIHGKTGLIIENNNIVKMWEAIQYIVKKPFKKEDITSSGNRFCENESAKRQLQIYKNLII